MKQYNLVLSEDDKMNLTNVVKAAQFAGKDAEYIVGLLARLEGAEEVEQASPPVEVVTDGVK